RPSSTPTRGQRCDAPPIATSRGSAATTTTGPEPMTTTEIRVVTGVVLRDNRGRVRRMRRASEATWGIPGGGLEPGETWSEAALRECHEETGWHARLEGVLGVYSDPATQCHQYRSGERRQFVGVVFLATPTVRTGSGDGEATELRW